MKKLLFLVIPLAVVIVVGCSRSYPTAPGAGDDSSSALRKDSVGIDDIGLGSEDLGGDTNPYGQGGNPEGWGEHEGELNFLEIEIEYINPYFYTEDGYPGYYIGLPMCFRIKITNTGERIYEDIDIKATIEYYETHTSDRYWYPEEDGNTLISVEKGEALPGETCHTWWERDFLPGQTLVLEEYCYVVPWETVDGLDQIHAELRHQNNGPWHAAKFYDEPEQSVFCPPPPPQ